MKLSYPFMAGQRLITDVQLKAPTGGTLADTRKAAENGDTYMAFLIYLTGSIDWFKADSGEMVEGKEQVKNVLRVCPWGLAEWMALNSMILSGAEDEIDLTFQCPKCLAKHEREEPVKVSEMTMPTSADEPVLAIDLVAPVEFKDARTGEVIEQVNSLKFRLPTIGDLLKAAGSVGGNNDTRLQYAAWAEAIVAINGIEATPQWRASYGSQIFERACVKDIKAVANGMAAWALDNTVGTLCPNCGKQYRQVVPTSSFFASGLGGN